jgi:manganese/zinc/iron transport system permease protein
MLNFITHNYNLLLVLTGVSLLGASAGLIGCFAVLRRRSLTGDALAHAALPGLCVAFLLVGSRNMPAMLLGALVVGLLGVTVIAALRRYTRIKEDAAIGMVLSVFFGAGVVLSQIIQRLPGGSKAGLDSYIFGKTAGMSSEDVYWITGLSLLTLIAVVLLYKEFKLISFDSDFAQSQGWPVFRLDLMLMGLIALAVVVGLPAVGVLMIAALLIVPAAAARFWTDRLGHMLWIAALIGIIAGVVGTSISATLDRMPTGPSIILSATVMFLVSMLFAPKRGLLFRKV